MEDLVFQLTIALQLKSEKVALSGLTVRREENERVTMHRLTFLLNRLQTGHKSLKGQSVAPPHQVTIATIYTTSIFIHLHTNILS